MKIFSCYTRTHQRFLDQHFKPSIPKGMRLVMKRFPQVTATGSFAEEGAAKTFAKKVELVIEACRTEREPFVYSDCDVRFYGPVEKDLLAQLGDHDIAFQDDGEGGACAGFFIVKPSPHMHQFFRDVLARARGVRSDQDAMNEILEHSGIRWTMLSRRYYTVGQEGHHWTPGMEVHPPRDILVHHANWTVGVENKLALLRLVRKAPKARKGEAPTTLAPHMIERHPLGATGAAIQLLEQERQKQKAAHGGLPLALVLQFWKGDKKEALGLARLLADIEPAWRDDVVLVFSRQSNCPMDRDVMETQQYCGEKFPVSEFEAPVPENIKYPYAAYLQWSSTVEWLSKAYHSGQLPCGDVFMFESDGAPMSSNWINRIKQAHELTLSREKWVTGPYVSSNPPHVNGSFVMNLAFWENNPSLHRCPPDKTWDIFHARVLSAAASPSTVIASYYGMQNMSASVWWSFSTITAWLTSVKDGLHQYWARKNLVR